MTAVVGPAIGKLAFVRPGAPGAEGMGQSSEEGQEYLVDSETGERSQQGGMGWTEKRNPFLQRSHGVSVLVL